MDNFQDQDRTYFLFLRLHSTEMCRYYRVKSIKSKICRHLTNCFCRKMTLVSIIIVSRGCLLVDTTYYITNKNNQLLELLNTIDHCLTDARLEEVDSIIKLKEELLANDGIHITPEQINNIISLLLSFVPDTVREVG